MYIVILAVDVMLHVPYKLPIGAKVMHTFPQVLPPSIPSSVLTSLKMSVEL